MRFSNADGPQNVKGTHRISLLTNPFLGMSLEDIQLTIHIPNNVNIYPMSEFDRVYPLLDMEKTFFYAPQLEVVRFFLNPFITQVLNYCQIELYN